MDALQELNNALAGKGTFTIDKDLDKPIYTKSKKKSKSKLVYKGHKNMFGNQIGQDTEIVDGWNANNILNIDPDLIDWKNIKRLDTKENNVSENMKLFVNQLKTAKTIKDVKRLANQFGITKTMINQLTNNR
jgi:hypothetical protein